MGLNVIITPRWMFVSVFSKPYAVLPSPTPGAVEGIPAYLDCLAYTGIVNLQTEEKEYPQTAGIGDNRISIFEAIEKSTEMEPLPLSTFKH